MAVIEAHEKHQELIDELIAAVSAYNAEVDRELIRRAFLFAANAHEGQQRRSGEDFVLHPWGAAKICAQLRLDDETIAAALLHDVVEDTAVSVEDVEREFVTMYGINSESDSWYIMDNVKKFAREPDKADPKRRGWINDNLRFDINGYEFGNMPMPTMRVGDRVRWYAMGDADNDFENHTPHWHGQSLLSMGMRTDTLSIQPASMQTADMIPDNPGVWLFHCHFPGHQSSGMVELFKVLPARSTAAKHPARKAAPMAMAAVRR